MSYKVNIKYPFLFHLRTPGSNVIKTKSCSTQLSMNCLLLISVKLPTIVDTSTFISRKNSILGLFEPEKC